jgi:hypothetical protein
MPSLVKANSKLSAGGMQLTSYSIVAQGDNSLGINADFVCLTRFDSALAAALRVGAPIPAALLQEDNFTALLNSLRAKTLPNVQSCNIERNYGLTTFRLSLGVNNEAATDGGTNGDGTIIGGDDPAPEVTGEVTVSTDLRSLSGSVTQTLFSSSNETVTRNFSFAFDYIATTITVENQGVAGLFSVVPGAIFNVRGNIEPGSFISTQEITSTRSYRNNLGQQKSSRTTVGVYIQTKMVL